VTALAVFWNVCSNKKLSAAGFSESGSQLETRLIFGNNFDVQTREQQIQRPIQEHAPQSNRAHHGKIDTLAQAAKLIYLQSYQNPTQIFADDVIEEKGENARLSAFVGAIAVGDLVKSTLGPKGMDKILQSAYV
jgi:hypothetical protein